MVDADFGQLGRWCAALTADPGGLAADVVVAAQSQVGVTKNGDPDADETIVVSFPGAEAVGSTGRGSGGDPRYTDSDSLASCTAFTGANAPAVCVAVDVPVEGSAGGARHQATSRLVRALASGLVLSASPDDHATWFDARDALPRG